MLSCTRLPLLLDSEFCSSIRHRVVGIVL
jgi:hypothetical protein